MPIIINNKRPEELVIEILNLAQEHLTAILRKAIDDERMNPRTLTNQEIDVRVQGFTLPLSKGLVNLVKYARTYEIKQAEADKISE